MALSTSNHSSRKRTARITGGLYIAFILASVLADTLGRVGISDAEQVYQAITTNIESFRLGLVIALVSTFLFLAAAWGLYVLLRPVNKDLALLFLLLNAVGVAIQCASMLALISAMLFLDPGSQIQAASSGLPEGLAYSSINLYKTGFASAQLFFGTWLFPLGYLVYRSRLLPRFLGVLLLLDGIGILIWFFQTFLLPAYPEIIYPGLAVSFIAEVGLGLWLLIKGVEEAET